jgi:hypothetical protein
MDRTEGLRRLLKTKLDAAKERAELKVQYGEVWNTEEMQRDFAVEGFLAPFVVVRRKSDGVKGSMLFQGHPRFYFAFSPEN